MSFVPIIAASSAAHAATARADELAKRIQDTVDEYRRQHPGTKDLDVRLALQAALRRNRCKLEGSDHGPIVLIIVAVALLLVLGVASLVFFTNRSY